LWNGLVTFVDFIASGAVGRYFAANWRYAMFFFVPFVDVVLFAAVGIAAGWIAAAALGHSVLGSAVAVAVAVLSFALLLRWPGERWRVGHGLADWIFARDYMLRRRPDIEARVEAFAERLVACVRRGDADEIIIAGHSLGATVVIDMLARALARDPGLGRHGPKLGVLTIGATIPKLALHPGGGWVREAARRVAAEPSLTWAEFQARDDIISFHKFHPVQLTRFDDVNDANPPVIRRVQIHQMLSEAAFRRYRYNFMRLHYQFVMANERRTIYDYFMLICGPAPFWQTVNTPNGPDDLYAADGSLRDPAVAD
jgi:pimeloyl-ACP methyl ester carboxylesterase